jgi:hypothetical protein
MQFDKAGPELQRASMWLGLCRHLVSGLSGALLYCITTWLLLPWLQMITACLCSSMVDAAVCCRSNEQQMLLPHAALLYIIISCYHLRSD